MYKLIEIRERLDQSRANDLSGEILVNKCWFKLGKNLLLIKTLPGQAYSKYTVPGLPAAVYLSATFIYSLIVQHTS